MLPTIQNNSASAQRINNVDVRNLLPKVSSRFMIWAIPLLLLVNCSSSKILEEPIAYQVTDPISAGADQNIEALLEWVIVRNGPGSWLTNANWDEYLIIVRNDSDKPVEIKSVNVIDISGRRIEPINNRDELIEKSNAAVSFYEELDIEVVAGSGADTLMAAGGLVALYGVAGIQAVPTLSGVAITASPLALGALIIGPAIVISGVIERNRIIDIGNEIRVRGSRIPFYMEAGGERRIDVFFPVTPSPQEIEFVYSQGAIEGKLIVNTQPALEGLHVGTKGSE